MFNIWLSLGIILLVGEFVLPGLVVMFVGLGSLTVALGIHLGYLDSLIYQIITFIIASNIYLFTLRLLILRFVPTETNKANVNEDDEVIGQEAKVVKLIPADGVGRIEHSASTWQAKSIDSKEITLSSKVKIVGRDNITWIVEKI